MESPENKRVQATAGTLWGGIAQVYAGMEGRARLFFAPTNYERMPAIYFMYRNFCLLDALSAYSSQERLLGNAQNVATTECGRESNITSSPTQMSSLAEGRSSGGSAMHIPLDRAEFVVL